MKATLSRRTTLSELRVIWMVALRGLKTSMRYKLGFVSNMIWPPITMMSIILMGSSFGATQEFVEATGILDFVSFFILGKVLETFWNEAVFGMGGSVRDEQLWGTLELTYMCPIRRISLFLGYALHSLVENLLWIVTTAVPGFLLVGLRLNVTPLGLLLVIGAFAVTVVAAYGFGFIIAGLVFRLKEPGALNTVLFRPLNYLSGYYYTINAIPAAIRVFVFVVPTFYSVDCLKSLLIGSKTFLPISQELAILSIFAVLFSFVGYRVFQWLEKDAMKKGTFATY
jgi:ABC-type polysaccharide/polyol phosphate export permease